MKKLTDEKQAALLEAGIAAFARAGFRGASIGAIAGAAGTSVGVLYKYYENKEAFFDVCLRHSLRSLEALLDQVTAEEGKLLDSARQLIRGLQANQQACQGTFPRAGLSYQRGEGAGFQTNGHIPKRSKGESVRAGVGFADVLGN